jgi:cell wall assembly regulator SMI1
MLVRTKEAGPRISESDVTALEDRLGVQLPPGYRAFLLKHNGGRPFPASFMMTLDGNRVPWRIHFFLGIRHREETLRLDWAWEVTQDTRPHGVIPIASDEGGNYLYLGTEPWNRDEVYFGATPSNWEKVKLIAVADSFEDFLSSLQHIEY